MAKTSEPAPTPRPLGEPPSGWTDPVRLISGVITAASAITTVWALWDLISGDGTDPAAHLVGLAAGLVVEGGWLVVLASNYQAAAREGSVARWRTIVGWTLAGGAALLLGYHGVAADSLAWSLLGLLPLISKTAWHVITHTRARRTRQALDARESQEKAAAEAARAQAERERALSTGLTPEQEEELAGIRRQAVYARAKAEVETELTTAEAEADRQRQQAGSESERIRQETESQMRQEAIRRQVAEQMAVQQANADLLQQRHDLETKLRLTRPYELGRADDAGERVPDDPSGFGIPPVGGPVAGFGAGLAQARSHPSGTHPGTNRGTNADLRERSSGAVVGGTHPGTNADLRERTDLSDHQRRLAEQAQINRQRVLDYVREHGRGLSHTEVGDALGMTRTTVRKHRIALAQMGHDVLVPKTD